MDNSSKQQTQIVVLMMAAQVLGLALFAGVWPVLVPAILGAAVIGVIAFRSERFPPISAKRRLRAYIVISVGVCVLAWWFAAGDSGLSFKLEMVRALLVDFVALLLAWTVSLHLKSRRASASRAA